MYYYTVCYFTSIFYAVVRQISVLFIYNNDSVFCILTELRSLNENKYLGICQKDDRRECSDWIISSESDISLLVVEIPILRQDERGSKDFFYFVLRQNLLQKNECNVILLNVCLWITAMKNMFRKLCWRSGKDVGLLVDTIYKL